MAQALAGSTSEEDDTRMVKFGSLMERGITVKKHFTGLRPGSAERVLYVDAEQTTLFTCKERVDPTKPGIDVKEFKLATITAVRPHVAQSKLIEIVTQAKMLVIEVDTERSRELLLSMLQRFVEVQSVKHGAAVVHEGYLDVRVGAGGYEKRFFAIDGARFKGYAMKISNQIILGADLNELRSVVTDPNAKGTVLLLRFAPESEIEPLALRHAAPALLSEWRAHLLRAAPALPPQALPGHDGTRGWLWKQALSGGGNWTRRYFVLPPNAPDGRVGAGGAGAGGHAGGAGGLARLVYFADEESARRAGGTEPKGLLTLTAGAKLQRGFEDRGPCSFSLEPGGDGKKLGAMAESEAECEAWLRLLQAAIDELVHNTSIFNAANPLVAGKAATSTT